MPFCSSVAAVDLQQLQHSCNTAGTQVPSCVFFRVYYAYSAAAVGAEVGVGVGVQLCELKG